MKNGTVKTPRDYAVTIARQDAGHAVAATREHELTLNVRKGDGASGFNAAETLLAALGTCLLTNINALAAKMRLQIDEARVTFTAVRQDNPPLLTQVQYNLILTSPEPPDKLEELYRLAVKWGTVANTVTQGIQADGRLTISLSPTSGSR